MAQRRKNLLGAAIMAKNALVNILKNVRARTCHQAGNHYNYPAAKVRILRRNAVRAVEGGADGKRLASLEKMGM